MDDEIFIEDIDILDDSQNTLLSDLQHLMHDNCMSVFPSLDWAWNEAEAVKRSVVIVHGTGGLKEELYNPLQSPFATFDFNYYGGE